MDNLTDDVERQIDIAIEQADVILFVVDARAGLVPLDEEVAERLRHVDKPILLRRQQVRHAANSTPQAAEFYKLGHGKPLCVSAQQNRGRERAARSPDRELLPPRRRADRPPTRSR